MSTSRRNVLSRKESSSARGSLARTKFIIFNMLFIVIFSPRKKCLRVFVKHTVAYFSRGCNLPPHVSEKITKKSDRKKITKHAPRRRSAEKNEISHSKTATYFKNRRKIEMKALRISKSLDFLKRITYNNRCISKRRVAVQ